jgi:hypothetical protein
VRAELVLLRRENAELAMQRVVFKRFPTREIYHLAVEAPTRHP